MSEELKPCPFCGGEAKMESDGTSGHLGFVCTHPARTQSVYVNSDDCPYNPCASENARSCPLKWSDS